MVWHLQIQTAAFGGVLYRQQLLVVFYTPKYIVGKCLLNLEVEVVVGHHKIVPAVFDDVGVELTKATPTEDEQHQLSRLQGLILLSSSG